MPGSPHWCAASISPRVSVSPALSTMYAGVVAVPAYPPDPMRLERTLLG